MMELVRILGYLLHKNWLVRKRLWTLSLVGGILVPASLFFCAQKLFADNIEPMRDTYGYETWPYEVMVSSGSLIDTTITYAPMNEFINEFMLTFRDCLKFKSNFSGFKTESDLNAFHANSTIRNVAIVFDESTDYSTKHLHYKIQGVMRRSEVDKPLGNGDILIDYTSSEPLLQIQICLDESFIKSKINVSNRTTREMFIQRVPYPFKYKNLYGSNFSSKMYTFSTIIIFMIPFLIEASIVTYEKFEGINALMSMNGVSFTLNIFSWIISSLLPLSTFCTIQILLMCIPLGDDSHAIYDYINLFVLFTVFTAHTLHMMTFGIHISAYFVKPIPVTLTLITMNVIAIILRTCVLDNNYLVPCFGIILPNIFLYQMMQKIRTTEEIGSYIQWSNLFEHTSPSERNESTFGLILMLSIVGMIFHFLLAIYINAINPGKYGVGKHPLFFFMCNNWKRNSDSLENLKYDDMNDKYFEPTQLGNFTPGIQIRDLKKSYNISFFSKEKVHALRGVSIDIYKGQITSLLGHNGAGKSTLISILTSIITSTGGTVFMNSKNFNTNASEILKDVGLCAQEDMYFSNLTVIEQLEFFAMVKRKDKSRSVIQKNVINLLQKLRLFNVKDALPYILSADQKRKLCLGIAFVGDPSILILDEPTSRLDHESKRLVWDILLEMKRQKTILISTHDMDEADILGDRIAIMHEGRLISYGSSLFLKKMIAGQNNIEITLSLEKWSDPDTICAKLHSETIVLRKQDNKIILSVPASSLLTTYLENLEKKKMELGVSSYSWSLASLERVFLKVTQGNDNPYKAINGSTKKLKGISLYIQSVRALLLKNMTCVVKEQITLIIQILTIFAALLAIAIPFFFIISTSGDQQELRQTNPINLGAYDDAYTLYTSFSKTIGEQYKRICQIGGGNSIEITETSLYNELIRRAKEDHADYNKNLIAAAEFNRTSNGLVVNAFYSNEIVNSIALSVNLVSNTIIQNMLGANYSINLSKQRIPNAKKIVYDSKYHQLGLWAAAIFVIPLYFMVATFVIRPARESSRGLKQLQKMTGVSGFTYWGTMLFFDMMLYTFFMVLLLVCFTSLDYFLDLQLYGENEITLMALILMLYAGNALPLVYIFSFINTKENTLMKLLTFLPIATGTIEIIILAMPYTESISQNLQLYDVFKRLRPFQKAIFLLLPYTSFFHAQIVFHTTAMKYSRCKKLITLPPAVDCNNPEDRDYCCDVTCYNGKCQTKEELYSNHWNELISFKESLNYICVTTIFYYGLLAVLEAKCIQRIKGKYMTQDSTKCPSDAQMLHEKLAIHQTIQAVTRKRTDANELRDTPLYSINNKVFVAYEIRKHYKKVRAVKDISFSVNHQECFGILGVNRAGKSVTLRMITGEEILDHGIMLMEDKHLKNNKKSVLSRMGYCPQQEAIIKCLNSYDHLRLFARLRGVPEDQVECEVQTWIDQLNLNACALFPSGIYSGGNKQRLNIAMALIGSPKLILLDEPTIGVDPGARRSFWKTIKSCQAAGQAFLLATHSMEECEALCDRMTIMVEGRLTCIGTPKELKQHFGAGYDVQIRMDPRKASIQLEEIKNSMRLLLPCLVTNETLGSLTYYVSGPGTTWTRLYGVLNKLKEKYECIDDYIVIVRLNT